jgi:ABC-type branched-subunit amino acid transport system ATPase component
MTIEEMSGVAGLRKRFRRTVELDGMSFTARSGQVTGFVGPNRARKTNLGSRQFLARRVTGKPVRGGAVALG